MEFSKIWKMIGLASVPALLLISATGCSKKSESTAGSSPEQALLPIEKGSTSSTSAATSTAGDAAAQAPVPGPQTAGEQKLIRISTLNSVDANTEFMKNVQLVQNQRQLILALNNQLQSSTDPAEKEQLTQRRTQALAKLNENNRKMLQTYGFTLNRNYMYVIEKSSVYMAVSEEEATSIKARRDSQEQGRVQ